MLRTLSMSVAESAFSHVGKLDGPFGARIHEPVAAEGVEFGRRDDLGQLLHIRGLDVDDIKALVLDVEVPEVYPQVVAANEGFPVAVDRDAVDVVGVGVSIGPAGNGSHDSIVVRKARELEVAGTVEMHLRHGPRAPPPPAKAGRREIMGQVVLRHHLERLLKHFPELYGFCRW